jgi:hypothetical protein
VAGICPPGQKEQLEAELHAVEGVEASARNCNRSRSLRMYCLNNEKSALFWQGLST